MNFYRRMRYVCLSIPRGCVATYGQIALLCGKPANSRQVGYGLRTGLAGEGIPAHRVVNSRGILSGAQAFSEPDLQERLLEQEGVFVEKCETPGEPCRVNLEQYGWKNTMDEAEELAVLFEQEGI